MMTHDTSAFVMSGEPSCRKLVSGSFIKMVSMTEDSLHQDDPWSLVEELLRRGKDTYDMRNFHDAINNLRNECQFNIHTLEKEVENIQEILQTQQQTIEYNQHHCSDWDNSSEKYVTDDDVNLVLMPALKAIFAGYKVTCAERERLNSAHPEDCS